MKSKISEVDVAKPIVAFLQEAGWEVFQEVVVCGLTADIIARNGKLLWAIETKTTLGMEVIGQAYNWRNRCHFCSVGVPKGVRGTFVETILKKFEMGCLEVGGYEYGAKNVYVRVDSPYIRKVDSGIIYRSLKEEQKTFAEAGNNYRKAWTPFQATTSEMSRVVHEHQGIEFRQLIKLISHHYGSYSAARNNLKKWIECGVIKNIVLKEEEGRLNCYTKNYLDRGTL